MTEDRALREPDLHLPPEFITNAAKTVANLYRGDLKLPTNLEFRESFGSQESVTSRMEEERGKAWRDEERKFPHLANQISGLRSALRKSREFTDHLSQMQRELATVTLTNGIIFVHDDTKNFLQSIFFSRARFISRDESGYPKDNSMEEMAIKMREELGLTNGVYSITLEEAVRNVLIGKISLTHSIQNSGKNS